MLANTPVPISLVRDEPLIHGAMVRAIVELAPTIEENTTLEFSIETYGLCRIAVVRCTRTGKEVKCLVHPGLLAVSVPGLPRDTRVYLNIFEVASKMAFPKAIVLLALEYDPIAVVQWEWKGGQSTSMHSRLNYNLQSTRWISKCGRSYFGLQIPSKFYEEWQRINDEYGSVSASR